MVNNIGHVYFHLNEVNDKEEYFINHKQKCYIDVSIQSKKVYFCHIEKLGKVIGFMVYESSIFKYKT